MRRALLRIRAADPAPFYDPWFALGTTGAIEAREMDEGMVKCGLGCRRPAAVPPDPRRPGSDVLNFWRANSRPSPPLSRRGRSQTLVAMSALRLIPRSCTWTSPTIEVTPPTPASTRTWTICSGAAAERRYLETDQLVSTEVQIGSTRGFC